VLRDHEVRARKASTRTRFRSIYSAGRDLSGKFVDQDCRTRGDLYAPLVTIYRLFFQVKRIMDKYGWFSPDYVPPRVGSDIIVKMQKPYSPQASIYDSEGIEDVGGSESCIVSLALGTRSP